MVAMAMFVLFAGLIGYALYSIIRKLLESFNYRIQKMVNAAEVAVDAFKFAEHGDIKES